MYVPYNKWIYIHYILSHQYAYNIIDNINIFTNYCLFPFLIKCVRTKYTNMNQQQKGIWIGF